MKPVLDLSKEYSIVLEGGGAKGAYQIGAWKALQEAGIKINAVAGTSVGALNGALICMGDVEKAEELWSQISYSKVMDVDDTLMSVIFSRESELADKRKEALGEVLRLMVEGGADITPLKKLIADNIDEQRIREGHINFYVLTFSISELKELDLDVREMDPGLLEDFLLASSYLPVFKHQKLHGKKYMDGGMFNNVPLGSISDRGYKDIIMIRIYGIGREKKVKLSEDTNLYTIAPRINLGSILEFDAKKSRRNMKIGYFDAKRMLFDLKGAIYYIEQTHKECYYLNSLLEVSEAVMTEVFAAYGVAYEEETCVRQLLEVIFPVIAEQLQLGKKWNYTMLYIGIMEAAAKLLRIKKYCIYTDDELKEAVREKAECSDCSVLPVFSGFILNKPLGGTAS